MAFFQTIKFRGKFMKKSDLDINPEPSTPEPSTPEPSTIKNKGLIGDY
jgi:hypothetical protein